MLPKFTKTLDTLVQSNLVIAISIIGAAYLFACGIYLSFTATNDIDKAGQNSLVLNRQITDMTLAVDLKSVAVNGWYAQALSNTQRLADILTTIAGALNQPTLDPVFAHDTVQWADESRSILIRDQGRVEGFVLVDASSRNLQRAVMGVFESQIQLVDQMADLVRHWPNESLKQRQRRLATWHATRKIFSQRYATYIAANEQHTVLIRAKSETFERQSQLASHGFWAIQNRMTVSNVSVMVSFTMLWILLGLRLSKSAVLTRFIRMSHAK